MIIYLQSFTVVARIFSLECGIWFVGIISVVYMPFQFSCLLMSFRCVQKVSDKNYELENVSDGVENVTDVQCEDVRKKYFSNTPR